MMESHSLYYFESLFPPWITDIVYNCYASSVIECILNYLVGSSF